MNTSTEETDALFDIVMEYGTVKSFAIRLRGVQFPEITQNTSVSVIYKLLTLKFEISSSLQL